MSSKREKIHVAAYVWPSYTGDESRSRMFWPEGLGEWQSVKTAMKKQPDHSWPRKPLWGYVNEANPDIMGMEIETAVRHGVDVFIYDWYWYDHRPFLEQCLNDGFLQAPNRDKMQFYLMWANHDANQVWNKELSDRYADTVVWEGAVGLADFLTVIHRVIDRYFSQPNYYRINGCPVFMIYDLVNLVKGLGGVVPCRKALDLFREETVKAGFPGLHLQGVCNDLNGSNLSGVDSHGGLSRGEFDGLGFDSLTHYQFAHFMNVQRDYTDLLVSMEEEWEKLDREYPGLYVPHVSIGWDNNPRFYDWRPYRCWNNTPENFERGLVMARDYLQRHPERERLVTVNSWNEWTETSYLEPDDLYGYGYLEAVKRVFGE